MSFSEINYPSGNGGGGGGTVDNRLFFNVVPDTNEYSPDYEYKVSDYIYVPVPAGKSVAFEMFLLFAGASSDFTLQTKFSDSLGSGLTNYNILADWHSVNMNAVIEKRISDNNPVILYEDDIIWSDEPAFTAFDGMTLRFKGTISNFTEDDREFALNFMNGSGYMGAKMGIMCGSYVKAEILN